MIDEGNATCRLCVKPDRHPACFPIPVSLTEAAMGHEVFQCERCKAKFKLTPEMRRDYDFSKGRRK